MNLSALYVYSNFYCLLWTDTDECTQTPNICGFGTCTNIADGNFYSCACQDGATPTGMSSDESLTCVGRYSYNALASSLNEVM